MTNQFEFKLKSLNPLRDTPERLGYKDQQQFLAVDTEGNLKVMAVYTGVDNLNKPVLKFPNTLFKLVTNVKIS